MHVNGTSSNDGIASFGGHVHDITAGADHSRTATIQSGKSCHSIHFDGIKTVGRKYYVKIITR